MPGPWRAEDILRQLDFPRDAAEGLERGRVVLETALRARGFEPRGLEFACHAGRADCAAALFVLAALCALWAAARHRSRAALAMGTAAVLAGALAFAGAFDAVTPSVAQRSLEVVVDPRGEPLAELLVAAHYDSKSEPLDHVGRSVLFAFAAGAWLAWALARGARPKRVLALCAGLGALAVALQLAGGRWMPSRSHGVIDDGAACALLVELACELRPEPLQSTRLRFVWFAGEEVGAQGSSEYARVWRSTLPRAVVNLECIGAGPELAYAASEWTGHGVAAAPAAWVSKLSTAGAEPVRRFPLPIVSDAGSFLRHDIPALTWLDLPAGSNTVRHLHGPRDRLAALDTCGLDVTRRALRGLLHALDSQRPWPAPASTHP